MSMGTHSLRFSHSPSDCCYLRIDAQWVTARKDWREAKRRHKNRMQTPAMPQSPTDAHAEIPIPTTPLPASSASSTLDSSATPPRADTSDTAPSSNPEGVYDPREMDQMRCILYSHGGVSVAFLHRPPGIYF